MRAQGLVVRRGFDLVECGSTSLDFGDDLLRWFVPYEGFRVVVPVLGPDLDGVDELTDTGEDPAPQTTFGQLFEPPLDEVRPRRRRRGEMQMPPGPLRMIEPAGDLWSHVSGEVVQDDVDLEVAGDVEIDQLEEGQDVGGGVGLAGVVEDLAGGHVHRREEIGGPVALVVMGVGVRPSRTHRQAGLGPIKGLALGFLVEAEDHGPGRGVHVQPDDVGEFLLEGRIGRDLERLGLPRLEVMVGPDARHGVFADPHPGSQRSGRPVRRGVLRCLFQRDADHLGHRPRRQPRFPATTFADHPDLVDAPLDETAPPCPHRVGIHLTAPGDLLVRRPVRGQQQALRLDHRPMRRRSRSGQRLKRRTLRVGQNQRGCNDQRHTKSLASRTKSKTDH